MLGWSDILWTRWISLTLSCLFLSQELPFTSISCNFIIESLKFGFFFYHILLLLSYWSTRVFHVEVSVFVLEIFLNWMSSTSVRVNFHFRIALMTINLSVFDQSYHVDLAVWSVRSHHILFSVLTRRWDSCSIIVRNLVGHYLILPFIISIMLSHNRVTARSWSDLLKPVLFIAIHAPKIIDLACNWLRQFSCLFDNWFFVVLLSLINWVVVFHFPFNIFVWFFG